MEFDRTTLRAVGREIPNIRAISRLLTPWALSSRIVVRCAWLNMLLLWDSPGQTTELVFHALNLEPRRFALLAIHLRNDRARQSPGSAVHNRRRHLQIAQEFGGRRCRSFRFRLPLRFEKQRGIVEKALPDHRWAATPDGIQLPGLPGVAVMLGERRGHPLAVLQVDAGYRHQELHRYVRGDFTLAHLLLDGLRQKFDQRNRRDTQLTLRSNRRASSSRS